MVPQLGRILLDEVGAQQIPTFAQPCLPQSVAIESKAESGVLCGNLGRDQAPGGAGLIARGAEFIGSSSCVSRIVDSCLSRAHNRFSWRRRIARSLATPSRLLPQGRRARLLAPTALTCTPGRACCHGWAMRCLSKHVRCNSLDLI